MREIRKHDRIYSIDEYVDYILKSSKINRFSVKQVHTGDIINFKDWWPKYYKRNCLSDDSYGKNVKKDQKITFNTQYMQFKHEKGRPGKVECMHSVLIRPKCRDFFHPT